MRKSHNARNCTQRITCRSCKEIYNGMHEYYIRKREYGRDGSSTESKESIKCAFVNGKQEAEVISMCVVPISVGHKNSTKMFKKIPCWITAAKVHSLGMN